MLDQVLDLFEVAARLRPRRHDPGQGLEQVTTAVLNGSWPVLDDAKPDRMLVHGDTTTTMAASLAAFYQQVPGRRTSRRGCARAICCSPGRRRSTGASPT